MSGRGLDGGGHAELWHQPYSVEPSNRLLDGLGEIVDDLFGGVGEPPAAGVGEVGASLVTVLDLAERVCHGSCGAGLQWAV